MTGTQWFSTRQLNPGGTDQQQRMQQLMPLFFVVFIISFPAGVIVYWVTTNSWTILQQYIVRKRIGPIGPPATEEGSGPGSGRGDRGPGGGPDGGGPNGSEGGGLGALLRGRLKPAEEPAAVVSGGRSRGAPPPPPPRKKKKRSGRRR